MGKYHIKKTSKQMAIDRGYKALAEKNEKVMKSALFLIMIIEVF